MTSRSSLGMLPAPGYGQAVRAWYDAADTLLQPWRDLLEASREQSREEPCACSGPCECCVPDADILVHARAGERRVVPLLLRNPGRRPLTVTVDVGAFSPCGPGDHVGVDARVLPDADVQLEACGRATVQLVLEVGLEDAVVAVASGRPGRRDEHCCTLVSDVRFVGCGSRAVRIAVIVLPSGCDAYEVRCDCGCC